MIINNLTKVLTVLSASAEIQKQYLKELGTFPSTDELALEFDDIYLVYKKFWSEKKQSLVINRVISLLDKLNSTFEVMSSQKNKNWDADNLHNSNWMKIRSISQEILNLLNNEII